MILRRFYKHRPLALGGIRTVRDVLTSAPFSYDFKSAEYILYYSSAEFVLDRISDVESVVKEQGQPLRVFLRFETTGGTSIRVDATNSSRLWVEVRRETKPPQEVLNAIEPSLQLELLGDTPDCAAVASAFLVHSFDDVGSAYANELSHFLSLVGIRPLSGRAFSPKSIAEKVQDHLRRHDAVFAIVTPARDPTWLTQEMAAAAAIRKPLFVLKQDDVDLKGGLLGDLEYIPFAKGHLSRAFAPILEGLRDLGVAFAPRNPRDSSPPNTA